MTRPRRLVALGIATAIVAAACAGLGIWQLERLSERRAFNNRLLERTSLPVLEDLPPLRGGRDDPFAYRRIRVEGVYDISQEVVLRARSLDGRAGNHVLSPLRLAGGRTVLVDRGWVPLDDDRPPVSVAVPPSGNVAVVGILIPSEPPPRFFGPRDPPRGRLATIGRLDMKRLASQIPYAIEPLAIALESQAPSGGDLPRSAGLHPPGEGPHLSYAVQWFLFASIAVVTGLALARRERVP